MWCEWLMANMHFSKLSWIQSQSVKKQLFKTLSDKYWVMMCVRLDCKLFFLLKVKRVGWLGGSKHNKLNTEQGMNSYSIKLKKNWTVYRNMKLVQQQAIYRDIFLYMHLLQAFKNIYHLTSSMGMHPRGKYSGSHSPLHLTAVFHVWAAWALVFL